MSRGSKGGTSSFERAGPSVEGESEDEVSLAKIVNIAGGVVAKAGVLG